MMFILSGTDQVMKFSHWYIVCWFLQTLQDCLFVARKLTGDLIYVFTLFLLKLADDLLLWVVNLCVDWEFSDSNRTQRFSKNYVISSIFGIFVVRVASHSRLVA